MSAAFRDAGAPAPPGVPGPPPSIVRYSKLGGFSAVDAAQRIRHALMGAGYRVAEPEPDDFGPAEGLQLVLFTVPQGMGSLPIQNQHGVLQNAVMLMNETVQVFTSAQAAVDGYVGYIVVGARPGLKARWVDKGTDDQRQTPGAVW